MLHTPSGDYQFGSSSSSSSSSSASTKPGTGGTAPQAKPVPYRRGHAHKRSAAISGDFDLDFFKNTPSINQQLSSSTPSTSYLNLNSAPKMFQPPSSTPSPSSNISTPPTTPKTLSKSPELHAPKLLINDVDQRILQISSQNSSPQELHDHQRLNSWAHSNLRHEKKPSLNSSFKIKTKKNDYESPHSSNESTPDIKRKSINSNSYQIPEPSIDLDLALGVYHDPSSSIPTSMNQFKRGVAGSHRRTESAPELEDFLKYKIFSAATSPTKNSAIVEEEEDEDRDCNDALSATSSNSSLNNEYIKKSHIKTLLTRNNNSSTASLNSNNSSSYSSCSSSTPIMPASTSTKSNVQQIQQPQRRGGASAARYQNYYANSALLSHALKSSESLVMQNKPSISSLDSFSPNVPSSASLKSSLSPSSTYYHNSPHAVNNSAFKFQSRAYDMPPARQPQNSYQTPPHQTCQSPTLSSSFTEPDAPSQDSINNNFITTTSLSTPASGSGSGSLNSPSQSSITKTPMKTHKKSNSLLSSLTSRIRGGSISSSSIKSQSLHARTDDDGEEEEGDVTITPFNLGEPGPALDLSSSLSNIITPKVQDRTLNLHGDDFVSPLKLHEDKVKIKAKKKRFFNWIKK